MLSILIFALAFGFATLAASADVRHRVVGFADSLNTMMQPSQIAFEQCPV